MLNDEKLNKLKGEYENIEIPEQLSEAVQNSINTAEKELLQEKFSKVRRKRGRNMKK